MIASCTGRLSPTARYSSAVRFSSARIALAAALEWSSLSRYRKSIRFGSLDCLPTSAASRCALRTGFCWTARAMARAVASSQPALSYALAISPPRSCFVRQVEGMALPRVQTVIAILCPEVVHAAVLGIGSAPI